MKVFAGVWGCFFQKAPPIILMDILIFNPSLRFSGVCDGSVRGRASERFCGAGSLTVTADAADTARFMIGGVVLVPGTEEAYMIESIRTDSGAGTAEIIGRGALSYFARRVLREEITYTGSAETLLCDLAETWGAAVVPGGLTVVRQGIGGEVNAAPARGDLLTAMEEICTAAGLGMRLRFDPDSAGFVFSVRLRREIPLFLSRSAGNLVGTEQRWDYRGFYNRAVVLGSGSNIVTADAAGLFDDGTDDAAQPLREIWVNATELAMSRYETEDAYREALLARGRRILAAHRPGVTAAIETTADTARRLIPGDVCQVSDWNVKAMCAAKSFVWDESGAAHSVEMHLLR